MNLLELKECFLKYFLAVQIRPFRGSFGVIFAIFGHFCKTEKARIGAISWAYTASV